MLVKCLGAFDTIFADAGFVCRYITRFRAHMLPRAAPVLYVLADFMKYWTQACEIVAEYLAQLTHSAADAQPAPSSAHDGAW
jgi:hypothetical protein